MRNVAAGLGLAWVFAGIAIQLVTYVPIDPEWTLLATFALFGTSFLVGAFGAFYMAASWFEFANGRPIPGVACMAWDRQRAATITSSTITEP